jgi:hypothetical protein
MAVLSGAEMSGLCWWLLSPGRPRNLRLIRRRDEMFLFSRVPKSALARPPGAPLWMGTWNKAAGTWSSQLPKSSADVYERVELYRHMLSWLAKRQLYLYPHGHDTFYNTLIMVTWGRRWLALQNATATFRLYSLKLNLAVFLNDD